MRANQRTQQSNQRFSFDRYRSFLCWSTLLWLGSVLASLGQVVVTQPAPAIYPTQRGNLRIQLENLIINLPNNSYTYHFSLRFPDSVYPDSVVTFDYVGQGQSVTKIMNSLMALSSGSTLNGDTSIDVSGSCIIDVFATEAGGLDTFPVIEGLTFNQSVSSSFGTGGGYGIDTVYHLIDYIITIDSDGSFVPPGGDSQNNDNQVDGLVNIPYIATESGDVTVTVDGQDHTFEVVAGQTYNLKVPTTSVPESIMINGIELAGGGNVTVIGSGRDSIVSTGSSISGQPTVTATSAGTAVVSTTNNNVTQNFTISNTTNTYNNGGNITTLISESSDSEVDHDAIASAVSSISDVPDDLPEIDSNLKGDVLGLQTTIQDKFSELSPLADGTLPRNPSLTFTMPFGQFGNIPVSISANDPPFSWIRAASLLTFSWFLAVSFLKKLTI